MLNISRLNIKINARSQFLKLFESEISVSMILLIVMMKYLIKENWGRKGSFWLAVWGYRPQQERTRGSTVKRQKTAKADASLTVCFCPAPDFSQWKRSTKFGGGSSYLNQLNLEMPSQTFEVCPFVESPVKLIANLHTELHTSKPKISLQYVSVK